MAQSLEEYVDQLVLVVSNDGRILVGVLKGFDQAVNLILDQCHERVFSSATGVEQVQLGLYIVRGDNVACLGELDEDIDMAQKLTDVRAEPMKPVVH